MIEIEKLQPSGAAVQRLDAVHKRIARARGRAAGGAEPRLIAVSKTFAPDAILPLIAVGQRDFGENRVQEAKAKWPALKAQYGEIVLHLIGPLQSNKAAEAVALFDVIHTVDREKIAKALKNEMDRQGRHLPCFVQVNIGSEPQKAGVAIDETVGFVSWCRETLGLTIEGLMCIPPVDAAPGPYFGQLALLADKTGVSGLSMGMSADLETAVLMGATDVRVGSALFGTRDAR